MNTNLHDTAKALADTIRPIFPMTQSACAHWAEWHTRRILAALQRVHDEASSMAQPEMPSGVREAMHKTVQKFHYEKTHDDYSVPLSTWQSLADRILAALAPYLAAPKPISTGSVYFPSAPASAGNEALKGNPSVAGPVDPIARDDRSAELLEQVIKCYEAYQKADADFWEDQGDDKLREDELQDTKTTTLEHM